MMSGLIVDGHDSISATSHKLVGVSDWGWYMLCLFMQCMYYALLKKKKEPWSIYIQISFIEKNGVCALEFFSALVACLLMQSENS